MYVPPYFVYTSNFVIVPTLPFRLSFLWACCLQRSWSIFHLWDHTCWHFTFRSSEHYYQTTWLRREYDNLSFSTTAAAASIHIYFEESSKTNSQRQQLACNNKRQLAAASRTQRKMITACCAGIYIPRSIYIINVITCTTYYCCFIWLYIYITNCRVD